MRPRVLTAVLVSVAGSYLLVSADAWDPLAGRLGFGAWALAAVAVGLVAAGTGRREAVLLAVGLPMVGVAVSLPFARAEEPVAWGFFMLPILSVAGACLAVAGAVGARALGHAGARRPRAAGVAELLAIAAAASAFAWGVWLDLRIIDRQPEHPSPIGDVVGTYRGLAIGDSASVARERLGPPGAVGGLGGGFAAPLGETVGDFQGPEGFDPGLTTWRYRGVAVLMRGDRTAQLVITDPSAQTAAGVGVGDSLEVASRAYAHLRCDGVITGSDATNPSYPSCDGHLAGRTGITFYGDPVQSVTLQDGAFGPRLRRRRG